MERNIGRNDIIILETHALLLDKNVIKQNYEKIDSCKQGKDWYWEHCLHSSYDIYRIGAEAIFEEIRSDLKLGDVKSDFQLNMDMKKDVELFIQDIKDKYQIEYNSKKIIEYINQAESLGLDIIAFPKNALIGFEMKDFIQRYPFILDESKKYLEFIAKNCTKTSALIGFIDKNKKLYLSF